MIEMNLNEKEAWSYWLGCEIEDFNGFHLHRNPKLNKSNEIIMLVSKNGFNISIPSHQYKRLENKLRHLNQSPIQTIPDIFNSIKNEIKRMGYILYQACPNEKFDYLKQADISVHLEQEAKTKLHELKDVCPEIEWSHSCLNLKSENTFGVIKDGALLSASHYLVFPGNLASLGMITHPAKRGQGYAQQATIGAVKHALNCNLMVHFQTLLENTAAIKLSKRLGFNHFGYSCRIELY